MRKTTYLFAWALAQTLALNTAHAVVSDPIGSKNVQPVCALDASKYKGKFEALVGRKVDPKDYEENWYVIEDYFKTIERKKECPTGMNARTLRIHLRYLMNSPKPIPVILKVKMISGEVKTVKLNHPRSRFSFYAAANALSNSSIQEELKAVGIDPFKARSSRAEVLYPDMSHYKSAQNELGRLWAEAFKEAGEAESKH